MAARQLSIEDALSVIISRAESAWALLSESSYGKVKNKSTSEEEMMPLEIVLQHFDPMFLDAALYGQGNEQAARSVYKTILALSLEPAVTWEARLQALLRVSLH